jgi:hypothetical protein
MAIFPFPGRLLMCSYSRILRIRVAARPAIIFSPTE